MNSAIIVVKLLKNKDIREYGSLNAGLTNVYRCFGRICAIITILMDLAKGIVIIFGTRLIMNLSMFADFELDKLSVCMISIFFAVLGHCFPVFYNFKGGKGILIAAVCMLFSDPMVFLLELILFVILVATTKYVSVGSLGACVGYPLFTLIWQTVSNNYLGGSYENIPLHMLIILPTFVLCVGRHWSNIQHLRSGEEKKFSFRKNDEEV